MAGKIKLSPDALSEILSKIQLRRINDGTHNFIRLNQKRIDVGIHNLLGSNQNKKQLAERKHISQQSVFSDKARKMAIDNAAKLIANGTHHLLGGEIQRRYNQKKVNDGIHHLLGPVQNQKRIDNKTHNLLGPNQNKKQLADGKHASQIIVSFPHCNKIGSKIIMSRWHFDKCKEIK